MYIADIINIASNQALLNSIRVLVINCQYVDVLQVASSSRNVISSTKPSIERTLACMSEIYSCFHLHASNMLLCAVQHKLSAKTTVKSEILRKDDHFCYITLMSKCWFVRTEFFSLCFWMTKSTALISGNFMRRNKLQNEQFVCVQHSKSVQTKKAFMCADSIFVNCYTCESNTSECVCWRFQTMVYTPRIKEKKSHST